MASKVNVGNQTPEQKEEALGKLYEHEKAQGAKIVEEDGAVWAVHTAFGLTVKTRLR